MLKKPDQKELVALHQLVRLPAIWDQVKKRLESELSTVMAHMLENTDPVQYHELRGRAKVIRDLIKEAETATETLHKMGYKEP